MSESDWDEDFEVTKDNADATTVILSGVAASPEEEENWDDDFDIEESVSTNTSRKGMMPGAFNKIQLTRDR